MLKRRKIRKSSAKLNTLDKIIMILGIFLGLFITTMIIIFICFQSVPDVLIQCVLGSSTLELFFTAWITVVKKKAGIQDDDS